MDALTFYKNLQYTFVAHLLKIYYAPLVQGTSIPTFRVDKRTWEEAFAPLMVSNQEVNTQLDEVAALLDDHMMEADTYQPETTEIVTLPAAARKEKKKKAGPEIDPATLRRSTRANKYDGFKAPSMAEGKIIKSKVKSRHIPSAPNQSNTTSAAQKPVPPPTPIPTLQHIGSTRCGILAEELSAAKLLASKETALLHPLNLLAGCRRNSCGKCLCGTLGE